MLKLLLRVFYQKKKIDRQIIIVTDNANIVISGDVEEIIVANQDGSKTPNSVYRFEYYSGAIEDNIAKDKSSHGILERQSIQ